MCSTFRRSLRSAITAHTTRDSACKSQVLEVLPHRCRLRRSTAATHKRHRKPCSRKVKYGLEVHSRAATAAVCRAALLQASYVSVTQLTGAGLEQCSALRLLTHHVPLWLQGCPGCTAAASYRRKLACSGTVVNQRACGPVSLRAVAADRAVLQRTAGSGSDPVLFDSRRACRCIATMCSSMYKALLASFRACHREKTRPVVQRSFRFVPGRARFAASSALQCL